MHISPDGPRTCVVRRGNQAYVRPDNLGLMYSISSIKYTTREHVDRILFDENIERSGQESEFFLDQDISWIKQIKMNIDQQLANIQKIAARLGWQPNGQGIECLSNFQQWILEIYTINHFKLELNNLQLTQVPPHLRLFRHLKELDLSNNNLRSVPKEIMLLENLESINLENNPIGNEFPDWFEKFRKEKNVNVRPNIVEPDRTKWAQVPCNQEIFQYGPEKLALGDQLMDVESVGS